MKIIKLSRGKEAIVDDEDFDRLNTFRWQWVPPRYNSGTGYAVRTVYLKERLSTGRRKSRNVFMHNEILSPRDGYEIDHRDSNGLDNRKENLRYATRKEQAFNRSVRSNNLLGLKGVSKATTNRYKASIFIDGKNKYLGLFKTPEEAALAYDRAASEFFRDFAKLNYPVRAQ